MSVSLLVFRGEKFNASKSEMILEYPISFQGIYNKIWEKAIQDCGVQKFKSCMMFTANDIPQVLNELNSILLWTAKHSEKDIGYIQTRIHELNDLLLKFSNGLDENRISDYWFDVG